MIDIETKVYSMDKKMKNLILLFGAIFVAVIFLSSYASFNSNNTNSSSTTTVKSVQTVYALGSSNAVITNYTEIASVSFVNASNSTKASVETLLSKLEANDSIQNYIYQNNSYQVVLLGLSAYGLEEALYNQTNQSNSINVGATADILLPAELTLQYSGTPISLHLTNRNYTVYMSRIESIGSTINVGISALLARNGSIYNNQIRISYSK